MKYKKQGISERRNRRKAMTRTSDLIKFIKGEEVKQVKKRKERKKETRPRSQPEAELRKDVKKWLDKKGWRWWRIENSISGRSTGIADFLVAKGTIMAFLELKGTGGLTGLQPEFQDWCLKCNMPYYVIRSIDDLEGVL